MERVLIVEDDKDIRDILKIYLKAESFQIWEAENGKRAFEILEEKEPDLVILDLMLPDINGLNVL
ncbi:regulatory protein VanR [Clostridium botulinum C str. Eklund]|nr:regulatory protein VanR [Clostridium botulinum C str. Eklund]